MFGDKEILLDEILKAIRQQTTAMVNCFNAVNQINSKISGIEKQLEEIKNGD